jgi:hypothetical protein
MHGYDPRPGDGALCRACGCDLEWHVMQSYAAIVALRDRLRAAPILHACVAPELIGWHIRPFCYRLLPRQLQLGDRLSDESGEWEIASRPTATAGGVRVTARVRRLDRSDRVEDRTWVASERISVRRATPLS